MGSKPNKLHIIFKIFGFLIFSVGILYICQFFTQALEEGFQTTTVSPPLTGEPLTYVTNTAKCTITYDSGRNIILCPNSNAANLVFSRMKSTLVGDYDNVCITSADFSSNYYTCYTRPSQPVFNDLYGIFRPFDPQIDNDTMAEDLAPSIDTFCASYNTTTLKVNKAIASTQRIYDTITNTVYSTNIYTSILNNLIVTYCTATNEYMDKQCTNLRAAYTYVRAVPNTTGLAQARNAVKDSLDSLSNISTKTYSIYNGSKCNSLSQYALSENI